MSAVVDDDVIVNYIDKNIYWVACMKEGRTQQTHSKYAVRYFLSLFKLESLTQTTLHVKTCKLQSHYKLH